MRRPAGMGSAQDKVGNWGWTAPLGSSELLGRERTAESLGPVNCCGPRSEAFISRSHGLVASPTAARWCRCPVASTLPSKYSNMEVRRRPWKRAFHLTTGRGRPTTKKKNRRLQWRGSTIHFFHPVGTTGNCI
jgi:hypothetical protein